MAFAKKKEDRFFVLFREFSQKLAEMSEQFAAFFEVFPRVEDAAIVLKQFESDCDTHKHGINNALNNSFITPFDREDIFTMAEQLDDLADYMEDIACRFAIYNVASMRPDAVRLAKLIVDEVVQIKELFCALPDQNKNLAKEAILKLNEIENEGDVINREALKKLFHEPENPVEIIKWKDLYENLESALDAGEHLADTVEGILTKNA